jgi:hypothetical protein
LKASDRPGPPPARASAAERRARPGPGPARAGGLARAALAALAALAASGPAGCGDDDDGGGGGGGRREPEGEPVEVTFECPEAPPAPGGHVIMVVDHGFDLSLPELAGKVVGCYQRVCDGPDEGGALPGDFEGAKRAYLERLATKDVSCRLAPGATLRKSASLSRIAPQKEAWNRELSRKTLTESFPGFDDVARVVGGEESYSYHGTWVASVLAYRNPDAKFVVVNDRAIRRSDVAPSCPSPAEFDLELSLYRDPDVRAAYAAAPYEQIGEQFDEIVRRFGVTLVNESFGQEHWRTLVEVCPGLDWRAYYQVASELADARVRALAAAGALGGMSVLSLVAAGNDGLPVDGPADALRCGGEGSADGYGPDSATALVGSYDAASRERSAFSDFGACVEAYAPGEAIVVTGPEGWLFAVSGTSFAAPLAARSLALGRPATEGGRGLRGALLASREPDGSLPAASFPAELLYRDKSVEFAPGVAAALAARAARPRRFGPGPLARPSFAPRPGRPWRR